MQTKILINGITLEGANLVPLLLKVKYWQSKRVEVTFFGNKFLKKQIDTLRIINKYRFIELTNTRRMKGKIHLVVEGLRRNILALSYINQLKGKYNIVYSISSVLDLLIFPYILQKKDKKILRVAVFDNIVPITDPGNKLIRFFAWIFFQISLMVLRSADQIYTGSEDLRKFLLNHGIKENKIIERGQAVRNEMIKEATRDPKYKIDALFVGRINETKGIYDMLEVLKLVRQEYPKFQLALIGEGDEATMSHYKEKIREMDLTQNIQFLGYRSEEEKFNIMKSSCVFWFLSTSQAESFGVALLEAVCCGKPAFAYNLSAYNYLTNGEAYFFKIHDYQAVTAKVIDIFGKKEFENQKGKLLIDKYSWEKIAEIEYNNFVKKLNDLFYQSDSVRKILINGITLEGANIVPLLSKIEYWQSKGAEVSILGNERLKKQIDSLHLIKKYNFIELKNTNRIKGRIHLIFEGLRRNFLALFYFSKLKDKFDVVYSISSVLDLLLFPYILKKVDNKIKRVSVFDNTVPFLYSGNILISFLAWVFYQISLIFLKDSNYIYVTRPELKEHLLKRGFNIFQLVITGSTIEMGLVKTSKKVDKYNIDALYVGRINEAKGIYDMLEVLSIVRNTFPNFQLALMGAGEEAIMKKYKDKINKAKLWRNIQFLGYKTGLEKFNIIKSSKCFWFLSHTESYPLAPLEAICCGLKTFVYDLPAYNMYKNQELIIANKRDYAAVAEKVIEIFDKKDFNNQRGKLLFEKICWSWDDIADIEYKTLFPN